MSNSHVYKFLNGGFFKNIESMLAKIESAASKTKSKDVGQYLQKLSNLQKHTNANYSKGLEMLADLYKSGRKFSKNDKALAREYGQAFAQINRGRHPYVPRKTKATYKQPTIGTPNEATLRSLGAPENVVVGTPVLGRYARIKQAIKNHPFITGAAMLGLANGTVRDTVGKGLQYYLTPYSQWGTIGQNTPNTANQQLRLNDGSVVPVTMGEDGILTIGQPSQEETGVDPTDAAIAQAIAEANAPTSVSEVIPDSVGGYTTNEEFNDVFENDAWDQ